METSAGTAVGSYSEALGGIAAIVLTILGLAHVAPIFLVAIATVAVGAALVIHSINLIQEFVRVLAQPRIAELGGTSAGSLELLGGAAGIVLGVLALLNIDPVDLVAIAAIGYGSSLLMSSSSASRMMLARIEMAYDDQVRRRLASEIVISSTVSQALSSLAAIVLGILALAGFSSIILVLIALLSLGTVILLNGAALGGAVLAMVSRP
jgi:hypothetical protein